MEDHIHNSNSIVNLIDNLARDQLLLIISPNNEIRNYIHSYLETNNTNNNGNIGHIGLFVQKFPNEEKTFIKCDNCDKLIRLEYHYGSMENNQDEYYSGFCYGCSECYSYEPNYDSNLGIIRTNTNNIVCIGSSINVNRPANATLYNVSREELCEFTKDCKMFIINTIPNWTLFGSRGRKGKRRMNKKVIPLVEHINKQLDKTL